MSRRILDETTKSTFASDDYLYMDGQTDGSSKITPDNLVRNTTVAQQLAEHIADAEDEVEQITADIEGIQNDITDVKGDIGDLSELETEDKSSLVNAINEARGSGGSGLTEDAKQALLTCFRHVGFLDDDADYYGALEEALYPPADLVSISAVYSGGDVYNTATLDDLKQNLVVTANMSDGTSETVTTYVLSGTIATGSQTITATYGGKTTTFTITVVEWLTSISAVYTQSGTVYDTDTLDSLKSDLVVTANYSDSTSEAVTTYTLSGTLTEGTSTVTVSYGGKTTTFNVTVTHQVVIDYTLDALDGVTWTDGYTYNKSTGELKATSGEHCTDIFEVQDCIYLLSDSANESGYLSIFIWDSADNYLGYAESGNGFSTIYSLPPIQLKPNYKYAVKAYNTGTFDPTSITMLPVDHQANAVSEFTVDLSNYINDITQTGTYNGAMVCELIMNDIFTGQGITLSTVADYINRMSVIGVISNDRSASINANNHLTYKNMFKVGIFSYQGNVYMQMSVYGVTTLADLQDYITNNSISITFNY